MFISIVLHIFTHSAFNISVFVARRVEPGILSSRRTMFTAQKDRRACCSMLGGQDSLEK